MVYYDSEFSYIQSRTTLKAKILAIDALITKLEDETLLKAIASDNLSEYWLDDGQTKIKTVYRGVESVVRGLEGLEALKQRYINRIQGNVIRMVPQRNFRRWGW